MFQGEDLVGKSAQSLKFSEKPPVDTIDMLRMRNKVQR
jgi:hypothetical protein